MGLTEEQRKMAILCHQNIPEIFKKIDDKEGYGHLVISHGYIDFIIKLAKAEVTIKKDDLKQYYLEYCKVNNISKELIEEGWKQFISD